MCSVIEIKNSDEYYIHYHSPESLEPSSMAATAAAAAAAGAGGSLQDKPGDGDNKMPGEAVTTPKRFLEDGASSEDGTSGHQSDKDSSPSDKRPEKEEGEGEADAAGDRRLLMSKQEVTSDRCSSLEGEDESNSSQCKSKDHEDLIDDLIRASSGTASGSAIHMPEVPITVNSHIPATPDRPQIAAAAAAVPAPPKATETSDSSTQVSSTTTPPASSSARGGDNSSKNPFLDEEEESPCRQQPESSQQKKVRPIEDELGVNNNERLMRLATASTATAAEEGSGSGGGGANKKEEKERKKEREKAEKAAKKAAAEERKAAAESRKREEERAKAEVKRKKEEEKRAKEEEKRAKEEERIARERARDEERKAREEEKQRAREEAKRAAEKLKLEQEALKKQQKQRLEAEAAALRKASKIPVTKPRQQETPVKQQQQQQQQEQEKPSRIPKARNSTVKAEKKPSFLRKIRSGGSGEYKKRSKSADNIAALQGANEEDISRSSDSELAGDTASECCSTRPSGGAGASRSEADLGSLTDTETMVSSRRLPEVAKKTKKKRWITIGGGGSSSGNNGKHIMPREYSMMYYSSYCKLQACFLLPSLHKQTGRRS